MPFGGCSCRSSLHELVTLSIGARGIRNLPSHNVSVRDRTSERSTLLSQLLLEALAKPSLLRDIAFAHAPAWKQLTISVLRSDRRRCITLFYAPFNASSTAAAMEALHAFHSPSMTPVRFTFAHQFMPTTRSSNYRSSIRYYPFCT